jgi:hypothetical protein
VGSGANRLRVAAQARNSRITSDGAEVHAEAPTWAAAGRSTLVDVFEDSREGDCRLWVWQSKANAICERAIGTIRRECLNWLILISESQLRAILKDWLHTTKGGTKGGRCHGALGSGVPNPPRGMVFVPKSETRHRIAAGSLVLGETGLRRLTS